MKLLFGIALGALGMWLYRSERVRGEAQERLTSAPRNIASVIDSAPLPSTVKSAAARVTGGTAETGESSRQDYIGTPGVESASGRDRTAPGGDLPPDMARP
jgi:hypothetical protein